MHVCLLLILPALLAAGCDSSHKEQKAPPPPEVVVTAAPVESREVVYTLEQVGSLEASDRAMLRSQVAAAVAAIGFKQGTKVAKGEVLVRLDDAKIQAEIRNLKARIQQLQVRLDFQAKTLERNRALLKKSAIPQHRFDQLASEVKETELAILQVQADLARQKELLTDTVMRAPFAGVVGSKNISMGDYLKVGDTVVEVVVLDPLEIGFQAPERYKSKLSLGKEVSLRVASEAEKRFKGDIFFISPTVDPKTRTFLVKARVANGQGHLNPGMFARVSLVTDVHPQARVIPWESVIQTEKETYIYLMSEGKARKTLVKLGKVTSDWAEVLAPALDAKAQVIVEGKFTAKDGVKVRLKAAQPKSSSSKQ